jgi:hypothetical protein
LALRQEAEFHGKMGGDPAAEKALWTKKAPVLPAPFASG